MNYINRIKYNYNLDGAKILDQLYFDLYQHVYNLDILNKKAG